jgi:hypothetical protein
LSTVAWIGGKGGGDKEVEDGKDDDLVNRGIVFRVAVDESTSPSTVEERGRCLEVPPAAVVVFVPGASAVANVS